MELLFMTNNFNLSKTTVTVNFTDLINAILISENEEPLLDFVNGKKAIRNNSKSNAISVLESALATYYNFKINGELKEIFHIDELPQYKNLYVNANSDLSNLEMI